jgi:hypothetical protein
MARPSKFTQTVADQICSRIADGESLRKICASEGMPDMKTVMRWLADDVHEELRQQYARAREAQADKMAEEILEIADDGKNDTYIDDNGNVRTDQDVVARSRLRVDARKWLASKMAPKKYGEKVQQEISGPDGGPIRHAHEYTDDELASVVARSGG